MDMEAAMVYLHTSRQGLNQEDVTKRLRVTGLNLLSIKQPPTWWHLLLGVLPNPFNILLTLLAVLSVAAPSPSWSTFIILAVMIVISVLVRFWQEFRSNVAAIKLQESVSSTATVRRQVEGKAYDMVVEEKTLVPGDVILLSPGDSLPADCLVIESGNLQISQSR